VIRHISMAIAVCALAAPALAAAPAATPETAINAAIADSAKGWNAGDLDRFMRIYSDSPAPTFVEKDGVIVGKAAIAARYQPRFTPEGAARRGTLSFEMLSFRLLDPRHALMVARYRLQIAGARDQTGPTSLVFFKEAGGWRIIADHSS
jgi:uncharacterized protein (TIGR02246 family)